MGLEWSTGTSRFFFSTLVFVTEILKINELRVGNLVVVVAFELIVLNIIVNINNIKNSTYY